MQSIPYLRFAGDCEQALEFYCQCFTGRVVRMQRFSDLSSGNAESGNKIAHAEFVAKGLVFMAGDVEDTIEAFSGRISIALQFDDLNEQQRVFDLMSKHGRVLQALQKKFWGARFGELIDQWGIGWQFNCQLETI